MENEHTEKSIKKFFDSLKAYITSALVLIVFGIYGLIKGVFYLPFRRRGDVDGGTTNFNLDNVAAWMMFFSLVFLALCVLFQGYDLYKNKNHKKIYKIFSYITGIIALILFVLAPTVGIELNKLIN